MAFMCVPAVFRPLMPLARKNGLRIVAVNWKGSSTYPAAELQRFKGDFNTQCAATEEEGRCLASVLKYFVESQKIPSLQQKKAD